MKAQRGDDGIRYLEARKSRLFFDLMERFRGRCRRQTLPVSATVAQLSEPVARADGDLRVAGFTGLLTSAGSPRPAAINPARDEGVTDFTTLVEPLWTVLINKNLPLASAARCDCAGPRNVEGDPGIGVNAPVKKSRL